MKSTIVKRSIDVSGRRTSISLEKPFWESLKEIALARGKSQPQMVAEISEDMAGNLSSTIRLYVLRYYRQQSRRRLNRGGPSRHLFADLFSPYLYCGPQPRRTLLK